MSLFEWCCQTKSQKLQCMKCIPWQNENNILHLLFKLFLSHLHKCQEQTTREEVCNTSKRGLRQWNKKTHNLCHEVCFLAEKRCVSKQHNNLVNETRNESETWDMRVEKEENWKAKKDGYSDTNVKWLSISLTFSRWHTWTKNILLSRVFFSEDVKTQDQAGDPSKI